MMGAETAVAATVALKVVVEWVAGLKAVETGEAVEEALAIVDEVAAGIRRAAEAVGTWGETHLWSVSDHGHEPVHTHEDLAAVVRAMGYRTAAHPLEWPRRAEVAVMVSGNAMAHGSAENRTWRACAASACVRVCGKGVRDSALFGPPLLPAG